ncbi:MAG TPA: HAMP domain-containing protein, partial [Candidatus Ozemobacteraceae bacterium]|nr:HAMP domain-containing protein [Candidatus Ozemobacteraceae bacterium]
MSDPVPRVARESLLRQAVSAWWMPFVLSLLPLLILLFAGREEAEREYKSRVDDLRNQCERISRSLPQATDIEYWLQTIAGRLRRYLLRTPRAGIDAGAIRRTFPAGMEQTRFWIFRQEDRLRPVTGKGFEIEFADQFARLLQELSLSEGRGTDKQMGTAKAGIDAKLLQRWRMLLGTGLTAELFASSFRGQPFHVIFQNQPSLMLWDLITDKGTVRAGFVCIFPIADMTPERPLLVCMKNWSHPRIRPGFLPLPYTEGPILELPLLHPDLCRPAVMQAVLKLQERMGIFPADGADLFHKDIRVLSPLIGRLLPLTERYWAFPTPVSPVSGHLGLLVTPALQPRLSSLERLAHLLLFLWGACWIVTVGQLLIRQRIPAPGVHIELVILFLALVSMPLMLSYSNSTRLAADVTANRLDERRAAINRIMSNIEAGTVQVNQSICRTVRGFWDDQHLRERLLAADQAGPLLRELNGRFREQGQVIAGILLFRRDREEPDHLDLSGVTAGSQKLLIRILTREWKNSIGEAATAGSNTDDIITRDASTWGRRPGFFGQTRELGSLRAWRLGERQWFMYSIVWKRDNKAMMQLDCFWRLEDHLERYLVDAFDEQLRISQEEDLGLAAYRIRGNRVFESAAATGVVAGRPEFSRLAATAVFKPLQLERPEQGDLVIARQSRHLPGYVLLARASTQIVQERNRQLLTSMTLLLLSLLTPAFLISRWLRKRLAEPIVALAEVLEEVGQGNLDRQVQVSRQDELGQAARSVNTMIAWLRERRMLSRFVAPQVLDVVAGGDYRRAMEGDHRQVAVLVSDIRSFTTLSETYPATAIFELLNRHMERMTRAIQREGGVIDRFVGDAIQAVFYERVGAISPAIRALRAAAAMKREHQAINREREQQGSFAYQIGIGVDVGTVVAGVIGDPGSRLDFSVLGEPLRRAGELEAASKQAQYTGIMVSPDVCLAAEEAFSFTPCQGAPDVMELRAIPQLEEIDDLARGNASAETLRPRTISAEEPVDDPASADLSAPVLSPGLLAFLWGLPLICFLAVWLWGGTRLVESQRSMVRQALDETLGIHENLFAVLPQAGMWLKSRLQQLPTQPFSFEAWGRCWQEFRQIAPRASFIALQQGKPLPFRDALEAHRDFYDEQFFRVASASVSPGFPLVASDALRFWACLAFHDLHYPSAGEEDRLSILRPSLFQWRLNEVEKSDRFAGIAGHTFEELVREGLGAFYPATIDWHPGAFFWLPMREIGRPSMSPAEKIDRTTGLMVFLPVEHMTPEVGYRFFLQTLRQSGLEGAVVWRQGSQWKSLLSDDFFGKKLLDALSQRLQNLENVGGAGLMGYQDLEDGALAWRQPSGDSQVLIMVGQRSQRIQKPLWLEAQTSGLIVGGWILLGVIWLTGGRMRRLLRRSLLAQMIMGFALVILPSLGIGFQLLETYIDERSMRAEKEQGERLIADLESMDRGHELWTAYACRLYERFLSDPGQLEEFRREMDQADPDAFRGNDLFWERLVKGAEWRGLLISNLMVAGTGRYVRGFMQDSARAEAYRALFEKNLGKLNPDADTVAREGKRESEKRSTMIGAQVDDFVESMQTMVPAQVFAGQLAAPRLLVRLMLQDQVEQLFYMQHLRLDGFSKAIMQIVFDDKCFMKLLFREWQMMNTALGDSSAFEVSYGNAPGWKFIPPFWRTYYRFEKSLNPAYADIRRGMFLHRQRLQDHARANVAAEAFAAGQPRVRRIRTAEGEVLQAAVPGTVNSRLVYSHGVALDTVQSNALAKIRRERLLLILLAGIALILAVRASRRFLAPLLELERCARRVTQLDFTARMNIERDDELGRLAVAFNRMTEGVQQGRLLRQFVSDSVQVMVGEKAHSERKASGEQVELVVLFTGVAEFKTLLKTLPADRLIRGLNE